MDIKTLILIGGGVMITAVVLHGFWIAWRARREPLRLNIVPDLIPSDVDEEARFKHELPNGGARIKRDPEQASLELEEPAPLLLETTGHSPAVSHTSPRAKVASVDVEVNEELFGETDADPNQGEVAGDVAGDVARRERGRNGTDASITTRRPAVRQAATVERAAARARVREVRLEPGIDAEEAPPRVQREPRTQQVDTPRRPQSVDRGGPEELFVLYVICQRDEPFRGAELIAALRSKGLRYGQMNIFHRLDPMSKVTQYSVANAVEPGTFDLSDVDNMTSPGLTFFLRLPGPQQPQEAFDDMWRVARDVAVALGGELRDDNHSVITTQTIEHYRARIVEFSRRTLSRRA